MDHSRTSLQGWAEYHIVQKLERMKHVWDKVRDYSLFTNTHLHKSLHPQHALDRLNPFHKSVSCILLLSAYPKNNILCHSLLDSNCTVQIVCWLYNSFHIIICKQIRNIFVSMTCYYTYLNKYFQYLLRSAQESVPQISPCSLVWKNAKLTRVTFVKSMFSGEASLSLSYHCQDA